jgi:hypothetical protein
MHRTIAVRRCCAKLALFAATFLAVSPVAALTLRRASLSTLSQTNDTIVIGKVVEAHSYWNDDHTWILTDYVVECATTLKGADDGADLTITMLGGTVDDTTVLIPGAPTLAPGRSYVIFAGRADLPGARGVKTLRDYTQGVFDVDSTKGARRAISQASRQGLVPDATGKTSAIGGTEGMDLDELVVAIRAAIGKPQTK